MDLMKIGAQLLTNTLDGNDEDGIMGALSGLLGDLDGNLDLGSIVSLMNEHGLASVLGSWLGDGDNDSISADQIKDLFGGNKISEFASQLNISEGQATESLADAVPQLVDKASSGGALLDSIGGISGAMDLAKKLF